MELIRLDTLRSDYQTVASYMMKEYPGFNLFVVGGKLGTQEQLEWCQAVGIDDFAFSHTTHVMGAVPFAMFNKETDAMQFMLCWSGNVD